MSFIERKYIDRSWSVLSQDPKTQVAPKGSKVYTFSVHQLTAARAVLAPITSLQKVQFPVRMSTIEAIHRLWKHRAEELQNAGLRQLSTAKQLRYTQNCPSLTYCTNKVSHRPCKLDILCPFCASLEAERCYENLLRTAERLATPAAIWYGYRRRSYRLVDLPKLLDELKTKLGNLRKLYPRGVKTRVRIDPIGGAKNKVDLLVSYIVMTDPIKIKDDFQWTKPTGLRSLCDKSKTVDDDYLASLLTHARLCVTLRANQKEPEPRLSHAVACFSRYPAGYLYAPAKLVADVLNDFSFTSLNKATGAFRLMNPATTMTQVRGQVAASTQEAVIGDSGFAAEEEKIVSSLPESSFDHFSWLNDTIRRSVSSSQKIVQYGGLLELSFVELFKKPKDVISKMGKESTMAFSVPGGGYCLLVRDPGSDARLVAVPLGSYCRLLKSTGSVFSCNEQGGIISQYAKQKGESRFLRE